jgi:hypothetical protein
LLLHFWRITGHDNTGRDTPQTRGKRQSLRVVATGMRNHTLFSVFWGQVHHSVARTTGLMTKTLRKTVAGGDQTPLDPTNLEWPRFLEQFALEEHLFAAANQAINEFWSNNWCAVDVRPNAMGRCFNTFQRHVGHGETVLYRTD